MGVQNSADSCAMHICRSERRSHNEAESAGLLQQYPTPVAATTIMVSRINREYLLLNEVAQPW